MNHGPKFQKVRREMRLCSQTPLIQPLQLMAEIKADVREMQAKGNYGDGKCYHRLKSRPDTYLQGSGPTDNG